MSHPWMAADITVAERVYKRRHTYCGQVEPEYTESTVS